MCHDRRSLRTRSSASEAAGGRAPDAFVVSQPAGRSVGHLTHHTSPHTNYKHPYRVKWDTAYTDRHGRRADIVPTVRIYICRCVPPAGGGPIGAGRCLGPVAKSPCRFRWRIHKPHPTDTALRVPGFLTHITLRAPGLHEHTSRCAPQKATPTPPYHRDSGTRQTHNSAPLVPGLGLKHVWWTSRPPTPP